MERGTIIKKFLTNGLQLDSDSLNFFIKNPEKIDVFFQKKEKLKKTPPIISLNIIENVFEDDQVETIEIKTRTEEIKEKINVDYFTNHLNKRYDVLRPMFTNRLDLINLISINKITQKTNKFSLIGLISEKNIYDKTIELEDKTGRVVVLLEESMLNNLVEDEIIGIVCEKSEDRIIGTNIIHPNISLKRAINKTKKDFYCLFISDIHMDSDLFNEKAYTNFINWLRGEEKKIHIFVLGDISSKRKDIEKFISDISPHTTIFLMGDKDYNINTDVYHGIISVKIEDVNILMFHGENLEFYSNLWKLSPEQTIINLTKKRHLNPIINLNKKNYKEDPYLIDNVPDIIVSGHLHQPGTTNYKGITIICNGSFISEPIYWLINLRTRESFKKDFS